MGFAYYSFTYLKQFLINKYVVQYGMYKQNPQLLLLTEEYRVPCYCDAKFKIQLSGYNYRLNFTDIIIQLATLWKFSVFCMALI